MWRLDRSHKICSTQRTASYGERARGAQQAQERDEVSLELMLIDKAEKARNARREMFRRLKVSPGVWAKRQV